MGSQDYSMVREWILSKLCLDAFAEEKKRINKFPLSMLKRFSVFLYKGILYYLMQQRLDEYFFPARFGGKGFRKNLELELVLFIISVLMQFLICNPPFFPFQFSNFFPLFSIQYYVTRLKRALHRHGFFNSRNSNI